MKLLLTDSTHSLGRALEHEFERESFHLLQPGEGDVDWTDAAVVSEYLAAARPELVINTLGWADNPSHSDCQLLPVAAAHLADACSALSIPMIQLSSYRVFGNENAERHLEHDSPEAGSEAGAALAVAEQAVADRLQRYVILRFSWLIGARGENRLTRLLADWQAGRSWQVSSQLRGAPTALSDAARVLVGLVKQLICGAECWGVYHYCAGDATSEAAFAGELAEVLAQLAPDQPVVPWEPSRALPEGEPASAILGCERIRDDFGVQRRTWHASLRSMVKQWLHAQASEAQTSDSSG